MKVTLTRNATVDYKPTEIIINLKAKKGNFGPINFDVSDATLTALKADIDRDAPKDKDYSAHEFDVA